MGMHIVYGGVSLCSTDKTHSKTGVNTEMLFMWYTSCGHNMSCIRFKSPHNVISVEDNVAHLTCNIEVYITLPTRYIIRMQLSAHSIALLLSVVDPGLKKGVPTNVQSSSMKALRGHDSHTTIHTIHTPFQHLCRQPVAWPVGRLKCDQVYLFRPHLHSQ